MWWPRAEQRSEAEDVATVMSGKDTKGSLSSSPSLVLFFLKTKSACEVSLPQADCSLEHFLLRTESSYAQFGRSSLLRSYIHKRQPASVPSSSEVEREPHVGTQTQQDSLYAQQLLPTFSCSILLTGCSGTRAISVPVRVGETGDVQCESIHLLERASPSLPR